MTADFILAQIKQIVAKQSFVPRHPISTDTLMLILHIDDEQLMPFIEELAGKGQIIYHPRPLADVSVKRRILGCIELVNA